MLPLEFSTPKDEELSGDSGTESAPTTGKLEGSRRIEGRDHSVEIEDVSPPRPVQLDSSVRENPQLPGAVED